MFSKNDIEILIELFDELIAGEINRPLSISRLAFKNPLLKPILQSSILAQISKKIPKEQRKRLYLLWKKAERDERYQEEFDMQFRNTVINIVLNLLKDKLRSEDLPTPVFPTSVASSEIPNYYVYYPKEQYTLATKLELFSKIVNSVCGRCGQRIYGLYIPEEGFEMREILKEYIPDFYNVNITKIAKVGKINTQEIRPFEYLFYLLNRVLQEMFRRQVVPNYHVELFIIERGGGRKDFYSHYIIPNLSEVFYKLYYGEDKYSQGKSKIKALISSFLVENWTIDANLREKYSEIAHAQIDRFLYYLFCHRRFDVDSILFLEDLKVRLGDATPIPFLEEVMSWI